MIRAEYRFNLPVSPQQAFEILSDPARDPEWQTACLGTRLLDGSADVGRRYEITFLLLDRRMDFTVEINIYDPGRHSRFTVLEGPFRYIGNYRYTEEGDGTTEVHWTFDVDPGDFFGIMPESLIRKVLVGEVEKDSRALRKKLEGPPPPLPAR